MYSVENTVTLLEDDIYEWQFGGCRKNNPNVLLKGNKDYKLCRFKVWPPYNIKNISQFQTICIKVTIWADLRHFLNWVYAPVGL